MFQAVEDFDDVIEHSHLAKTTLELIALRPQHRDCHAFLLVVGSQIHLVTTDSTNVNEHLSNSQS